MQDAGHAHADPMTTAQQCLEQLNQLTVAQSSEARREALRCITDLFLITSERMTQAEASFFGDAMGKVARTVEVDARAELSQRIAARSSTPRNLALLLANDAAPVAAPVLQHSASLTADDLVKIAETKGQQHLMAIAKRQEMPERITDVLVRRGEAPVLTTVARNTGARFSPVGYLTLATRAETDIEINEAISDRHDVPRDVRAQVNENIARGFEQERKAAGLKHSLDEVIDGGEDAPSSDDLDPAKARLRGEIDHLHRCGQLKEATVVRLAEGRRKRSAAYALALVSSVDPQIVGRCLFHGSPMALAILTRAVAFEKRTLWHLIQLRKYTVALAPNFIAIANDTFEHLDASIAQRVLRFLKIRLATEETARTGPA